MRMTDLRPGWVVVGNDGRRLGSIKEVGQNYVLTSPGDLYVPASAIANVADGTVQLNLAQREAMQSGWQQPPRADDTLETAEEPDLHRHI